MIGREGSSPKEMRDLQDRADELIRQDPAVAATFTMTGNGAFLSSNQGLLLAFLKSPDDRAPIQEVAGGLMGKLSDIPGVLPFMRPRPVLEISTGATNQNQGQYAFSLSGVNQRQVYDVATRLMERLRPYPGFVTLSSDYFNNTPNLDIEIRRDQAKMYGVSETRILTLLRNAYSQNYLYLIKKPEDQYQVILEAEGSARSQPEDLSLLYIKSDDGKNLVPLNALVTWNTSLGPQAVNHLNQFTSVTLFFNLKPGVPIGEATDFITKTAAEVVPPTVRASLQGEALTFSNTVRDLTILMFLAVFVMYVILAVLYESYLHPLTVLSTLPTALVGGLLTLYLVRPRGIALRFCRHVHVDGHRQEERHHDCRFRSPPGGCGRVRGEGDSRCQHGPFPPDPYDDARCRFWRAADRSWLRRRRRFAPAARTGHRRRLGRFAVHHALHHPGHLSLPRAVPGESPRPHFLFPLGAHRRAQRRPDGAIDRGPTSLPR